MPFEPRIDLMPLRPLLADLEERRQLIEALDVPPLLARWLRRITEAGSVGMKSFGFGARCAGIVYGFYSENADLIDVTRTLRLGDRVRVQYDPKSVKKASDGSVLFAEFLKVEKQ